MSSTFNNFDITTYFKGKNFLRSGLVLVKETQSGVTDYAA